MEDADVVLLNTCHIREKAAEKVYSDLGRIRQVKDARRQAGKDTIVAVAGCVAQAEGAEIAAPRAGRRPRGRPAELSPAAASSSRARRDGQRRDRRDGLPRGGQVRRAARARRRQERSRRSSPCRRAATSSAPSASCPTRAAPSSRAPSPTSRPRRAGSPSTACARSRCSARTSTPTTALGPDGRPWSLARLIARLAGIDGIERIRYTTSHPRDMTRRPDRRASPTSRS